MGGYIFLILLKEEEINGLNYFQIFNRKTLDNDKFFYVKNKNSFDIG